MKRKNTLNQGIINVALLFGVIFICLGFCSTNKGLFLTAICEAIDVPRTAFSISTSTRYLVTAVVNVFFGYLVMKFGTKKLISLGIILLIASMLINAVADSVIIFIISEAISGVGFSLSGTAMVGCVVTRWYPEKKGTIMGAILCANGLGGAVSAWIVTPYIHDETDVFGYRGAYLLIAAILTIILLLILFFFKDKNDNSEKKKNGADKKLDGLTLKLALRHGYFYLAVICIFFTGFCLQGIYGIAAAHMEDSGLNAEIIALITSISLLALTGAKFLSGFMYDRIGLRLTITVSTVCAAISMTSLAFTSDSALGKICAIAYALISSVALPLETVMLPLYAIDLFGNRDFDRIMGIFISANVLGYAAGTPLINLGYDLTGSYQSVLIMSAIIMISVTLLMQYVISAAHRTKKDLLDL